MNPKELVLGMEMVFKLGITSKELKVLLIFMRNHEKEFSLDEIATSLNVSKRSIYHLISTLKLRGLIFFNGVKDKNYRYKLNLETLNNTQ